MSEKMTILLVDDKKENLFALERLLEDLEVNILQTTSGLEALKIVLDNDIATILLDVQMPEIDGYEVAKTLKKNNKTKNIPIIFVTAINQEQEHVLQGYESGAVDYLFKPLNPSITVAKVKAFIKLFHQQKELEKKNSELAKLNMLFENAVDLMVILDGKTFKIENFNPSWNKTLGYQTEELSGAYFPDLVFSKKEVKHLLERTVLVEDNIFHFETQVINQIRKSIWFSWSFVYKDGKLYGNGRNINDKRLAEQALNKAYEELEDKVKSRTKELEEANNQLRSTNADLDSFVYTASHDLKLPIANLEGLHQTLTDELPDENQEVKGIAEMVGLSIVQLKETINDLIGIIRKPKGLNSEEPVEEIECKTILEEIKFSIQELITSSNAEIHETIDNCTLNFPKASFKSILYNLLTNSLKYSSPERRPIVKINLTREKDFSILAVADNGIGISKEGLKKLFDKFERLNQSQSVEGTGIGLYIVKNTVEKHGGKIEVESEEGKGSVFKIYIPSE